MAAKHKKRIASTLKSLLAEGLIFPVEDQQNFEALIKEFLDNSNDDTRSEDEQVHFLGIYFGNPALLQHRILGKITKSTRKLTLREQSRCK